MLHIHCPEAVLIMFICPETSLSGFSLYKNFKSLSIYTFVIVSFHNSNLNAVYIKPAILKSVYTVTMLFTILNNYDSVGFQFFLLAFAATIFIID